MTKQEAKTLYEYYDKLVTKLTEAKLKLIDGGVKSYTIDGRSLTRFDLPTLTQEIDDAIKKRSEYGAIMRGKKARRSFGIIPRDF